MRWFARLAAYWGTSGVAIGGAVAVAKPPTAIQGILVEVFGLSVWVAAAGLGYWYLVKHPRPEDVLLGSPAWLLACGVAASAGVGALEF